MFKYIGLLGAALAGLAYYFLQSTPVNFELKKFIRHEPSLVFKFLKDPNYMLDIHPKVCVLQFLVVCVTCVSTCDASALVVNIGPTLGEPIIVILRFLQWDYINTHTDFTDRLVGLGLIVGYPEGNSCANYFVS